MAEGPEVKVSDNRDADSASCRAKQSRQPLSKTQAAQLTAFPPRFPSMSGCFWASERVYVPWMQPCVV